MLTKRMSQIVCVSAFLAVTPVPGQERSTLEAIRVKVRGPLRVDGPIRTDPASVGEYAQRTGVTIGALAAGPTSFDLNLSGNKRLPGLAKRLDGKVVEVSGTLSIIYNVPTKPLERPSPLFTLPRYVIHVRSLKAVEDK